MSVANYDKLNPHILEEKTVESTFQLHFQGKRFPEWKILYLIKFKLSTVQLFLQELTDWHCCISLESVKIIDLPPGIYPRGPLTYFNDGGGGGVWRIFLGVTFWPKGIFWGLWKTLGFFGVAKTTQGFLWVLYFSSAQIKNNISAIYSFVFDQNQSWSWHVLAFQKINNKICWCKNTEGFFWVC